MMKRRITFMLSSLPLLSQSVLADIPHKNPNVLFICIDDLRQELGCYGSVAQTPNLDKLADRGSLFFHHYVQVPTSGASRASMLTGQLPKKNRICRMRLAN
ncbi:sulfatase-like hydrolase/transferase [Bacteroides congonensis]